MALYGQGNQRLWEALIKLYANTIMQENKYNGGSYHIFSLIGFIIRQKYRGALETEEFEGQLSKFVDEYKNFCRNYVRYESLPLHKYTDIPQLYEEAKHQWRNALNHKDDKTVDIIKEIETLYIDQQKN